MKRKIYLFCAIILSLWFVNEFRLTQQQILTYSILLHPESTDFFSNFNVFLIFADIAFALTALVFWSINVKKEKTSKFTIIFLLVCSVIITYLAIYNGISEIIALNRVKDMHGYANADYYYNPIITFLIYCVYGFILFWALRSKDEASQNHPLITLTNGLILTVICFTILISIKEIIEHLSCGLNNAINFNGRYLVNYIVTSSIIVLLQPLIILSIRSFYLGEKHKLLKASFIFSIIAFIIFIILPYIESYILEDDFLKLGHEDTRLLFIIVMFTIYITTAVLTKKRITIHPFNGWFFGPAISAHYFTGPSRDV